MGRRDLKVWKKRAKIFGILILLNYIGQPLVYDFPPTVTRCLSLEKTCLKDTDCTHTFDEGIYLGNKIFYYICRYPFSGAIDPGPETPICYNYRCTTDIPWSSSDWTLEDCERLKEEHKNSCNIYAIRREIANGGDISLCDKNKGFFSTFCKIQYYERAAFENNNPDLCDNIYNLNFSDKYFIYSGLNGSNYVDSCKELEGGNFYRYFIR